MMQSKTIKALCAYKGVQLSTVAEKMGKTLPNFSQQLKRDDFRESDLKKIADILGCDYRGVWTDRETGKEFDSLF